MALLDGIQSWFEEQWNRTFNEPEIVGIRRDFEDATGIELTADVEERIEQQAGQPIEQLPERTIVRIIRADPELQELLRRALSMSSTGVTYDEWVSIVFQTAKEKGLNTGQEENRKVISLAAEIWNEKKTSIAASREAAERIADEEVTVR